MHRTKKIIVTATAAALLMAGGVSTAMADDSDKVTICHRTNSDKNPYVIITVSKKAVDGEGRNDHTHHVVDDHHTRGDIIPAYETDDGVPYCTTPPGEEPPPANGHDCDASSDSGDSTQSQHGLVNVGNINLGLNNLLANGFCHSNVGNGLAIAGIGDAEGGYVGSDSGDGDCFVESSSGNSSQEQEGLVNVGNVNLGLNNLLGNGFCHSNVGNGLAIAGIGDALAGGVGSGSGDGDCMALSGSGDSAQDQDGGVNVGNLNLGGNNLLANAFCQSNLLNGLAIAGIGDAEGGYVGDSGDGDCLADSFPGGSNQDQDFGVNVGNLNLGGDNLLANAFCGSGDVLDGLAVSLIGPAIGGSSLGSGLLSGSPGWLLSGLTTDVSVLANVLVIL